MPEIQFEQEQDFTLPEDYVLICNASGVPNANLIPIYHLGKSRIRAIAINCGVADRKSPTEQERNSAIRPAEWLRKFAVEVLNLPSENVRIFDGDPDNFCDWANVDANSAVGWIGQFSLPVLANFQGGTTQMSLGLAQALADSSLHWLRMLVGKFPPLTHIPVRVGNRFLDWKVRQPSETVPVEILLNARGYERYSDDELEARNSYAKVNAAAATAIYRAFFPRGHVSSDQRRPASDALSLVNRLCTDKTKQPPFVIDDPEGAIARYFAPNGKKAAWNGGKVDSDAQRSFLGGGWLEQAICEEIAKAVDSWGGFNVEPNLTIRQMGSNEPANEIDILLRQGELWHLIEVKAGRSSEDLQKWGDKLVKLNRNLAGRPARTWLCAPFIWIQDAEKRKELIGRYDKSGVTLLFGNRAVSELLEQIGKLPF
jgi:Holliday junction resolvase-like predicted endonuclease